MKNSHQQRILPKKPVFAEEDCEEMQSALDWELSELSVGRRENALLIEAMVGNWSISRLRNVAAHRGRSWRFLSSLTDKTLQIQGWGVLEMVADAVGHDLSEQTVRKALASLERHENLLQSYIRQHGDDPIARQIVEDAMEDVLVRSRRTRSRFAARIDGLMPGGRSDDWND